jgi:hypothetical protein
MKILSKEAYNTLKEMLSCYCISKKCNPDPIEFPSEGIYSICTLFFLIFINFSLFTFYIPEITTSYKIFSGLLFVVSIAITFLYSSLLIITQNFKYILLSFKYFFKSSLNPFTRFFSKQRRTFKLKNSAQLALEIEKHYFELFLWFEHHKELSSLDLLIDELRFPNYSTQTIDLKKIHNYLKYSQPEKINKYENYVNFISVEELENSKNLPIKYFNNGKKHL